MFVKICGIKRAEDALMALNAGADVVGILVGQRHASPDFISPAQAKRIIEHLPSSKQVALVTHLETYGDIKKIIRTLKVKYLQLHAASSIPLVKKIRENHENLVIIKAICVKDNESIREAKMWAPYVDMILLDSAHEESGAIGGTGITHDWNLSKIIIKQLDLPVVLAGGLKTENLIQALEKVNPFGVDANSGLQNREGFKDFHKTKSFIELARKKK